MRYSQVDSREILSDHDFVQSYGLRDQPVRIVGGAKDWPALKVWSPEWFKKSFGSKEVVIYQGSRDSAVPKAMLLKDFIEAMPGAKEQLYLKWFRIPIDLPVLQEDLSESIYCKRDIEVESLRPLLFYPMLWMGKDTIQPLHIDEALTNPIRMSNLFVQVYGRKYVILIPPSQTSKLYQKPRSLFSNIDAESVDLNTYPLCNDLEGFATWLEPGDLLYIPPLYWHYMRAEGISISVSLWHKSLLDRAKCL